MRVGFIGLGDQGGPMAQTIVQNGYALTIWARRAEAADPFRKWGAEVAESAASLARANDLVCLCVTGDADVRQLLVEQGMIAAMRRRSILAIHSTIRPETCVEMAALAAKRGVILLDLPVSGSGHAALARKLLVMAGGDGAALARVMPVLESYAGTVIRMGAPGAAMKAKLVNNLMGVVNIGQAFHALLLGRKLGINPVALREALMVGTGRTFAIELIARLQLSARAAHVLAIVEKDVALALESIPDDEKGYWGPLARTGLDALAALVAGSVPLLPDREENRGEHIIHRTN